MAQTPSIFKKLINEYLDKLHQTAKYPDASPELSYRPAFDLLLHGLAEGMEQPNFSFVPLTEPKRKTYGTPDYKIKTSQDCLIGYIETKALDANLIEYENSEQMLRYRNSGQRVLLTNYLEFTLFEIDTTASKSTAQKVASACLISKERLLSGKRPQAAELDALYRLFERFLREARPDINTPKELAERLAGITRHICDLLRHAYNDEKEDGDLHSLKSAFEKTLIHNLSVEQFTDMYAQTIVYGLFAARCNHRFPDPFNLDTAWRDIPKTNPFLRKLFESVTGSALEGKSYHWIIEDLVHLLAEVDFEAILRDFGSHTQQKDPVFHFYETFLAAYDPKLREKRGVYYTPGPVVSYIVRSVDYLLKKHFGCPEGLADAATKEISYKDEDGNEKRETQPRVLILDPACGTGTFLYEVIDHIREQFMRSNNAGMWSDYVRRHLLPRIFGFELLMAPYAVAHLKLGMQLAGQDLTEAQRANWAYDFAGDERLGIYLTNTLEEAEHIAQQKFPFARFIAEEANAAAHIKRDLPIMVVLGNPPYSGISHNKGDWIKKLVRDYYRIDGKPLGERKTWLQDDYVKFIRFGQWRIQQTGTGILAFISNNGYLDNPTFRGMRQQLMQTFSDIYILDLHGNAKKKERCPDGSNDKNVFDIQQGVTIGIFVKEPEKSGPARIHHAELWGLRQPKYDWLLEHDLSMDDFKEIKPTKPFYFFIPRQETEREEYNKGWKVTDIFPVNVTGIVTARDGLVIDFDKSVLKRRIEMFKNLTLPDEIVQQTFRLKDTRGWKFKDARKILSRDKDWGKYFREILYRPFDIRRIYYSPVMVDWGRPEVMHHMLAGKNLGIITTRQTRDKWDLLATRQICGHKSCAAYDINSLFPLYLYPDPKKPTLFEQWPTGKNGRRPNLNPKFAAEMETRLGLKFIPDGRGDLQQTFGPEDIFHYTYAVFHSSTYRSRYAEFLKIDFPRLPLTSDLDLFRILCAKGADLVALHLLEDNYPAASWKDKGGQGRPPLQRPLVSFPVPGTSVVEKITYKAPGDKVPEEATPITRGRVYVNKGRPSEGIQAQYFDGVPPEVWEFQVGGYQVCQKWLKDRKDRSLSFEDVRHYQRIVAALQQTIKLMDKIDEIIPSWPLK